MPNPLTNLYNQIKNTPPVQPKKVEPNFENLNSSIFHNNIYNAINMSEYDLCVFLKNNMEALCKDIMEESTINYASHFQNDKFIDAFIKAVNSIPLNNSIITACNKITYDYFTSDNAIQTIKQKYLSMAKIVNRDMINRLIAIGLDENTASNLALCRKSSNNEKTNIKRLNFAIYFKDPEVMNEQMIVWIYEKMFDRISELFQTVMLETYTDQQQKDFGDNFMEVYGIVSLAVLCILNNMTSNNIRKVLIGYTSEWTYIGKPRVRFSLHALSNDYSRISRVVETMTEEGIIIP